MADPATKYVHLHGPSEIRFNQNGELELYLFDENDGTIINPDKPFILNLDPAGGRIKFLSSVMLGEFSKEGFEHYQDILTRLDNSNQWETAQVPDEFSMPNMNPIKTPPDEG